MAKIFSGAARVGLARFVDPVARGLLRVGISPDVVTVLGTVGVLVGALGFGARGQFLIAVAIVVAFAPIDMIDGAMARARGYSTRFGALLDSTMDRIADGAIFGSVAFWYATTGQSVTMAVALVCLVAAQVISYVKARAQSLGFECEVGIAERGERLVLIGVGALADRRRRGVGTTGGAVAAGGAVRDHRGSAGRACVPGRPAVRSTRVDRR